jgi:hypothetical protein
VADDLVLGIRGAVIAHQFKKSETPKAIGLTALLLGQEAMIGQLANAYTLLKQQFVGSPVSLRFVSNDYPSSNDRLIKGNGQSSTSQFLAAWRSNPNWTLQNWQESFWRPVIDQMVNVSGLGEQQFNGFWGSLDLVLGADSVAVFQQAKTDDQSDQVEDLAKALSMLVADNSQTDRWTRSELLSAVGWPDRFSLRFLHQFPIGTYVQQNEETEAALSGALETHTTGYLSLVGPPGSGKSTLLQWELRDLPGLRLMRYLAFVPGAAQGQGRGEAISFLDDLNTQLAASGLKPLRVKDDTLLARQQNLENLLTQAGQEFSERGTRFVIIVDGLDHIPREERPNHSLLKALPSPQTIPEGVLFILGTQRLDLEDIPATVRQQANQTSRRIDVAPLSLFAVTAMIDAFALSAEVKPKKVYKLSSGHPLATRYLLEQLAAVADGEREQLLANSEPFGGDLEAVYDAAWRGIEGLQDNAPLKKVLALLAHAEGRIRPQSLAQATSDDAVEVTLGQVRHLLDVTGEGWQVFHNSFRLYLQRKPVLRFGQPDADFEPDALFSKLSELSANAVATCEQRWLEFRYRFLARDLSGAVRLASREYFVDQYCSGRPAHAVRADISDALRALIDQSDPIKLFDLMLADDEVSRRATIMESATALINAQLAIGDTLAANASISGNYPDGKQWLVLDALLEEGQIELARRLFERQNPFGSIGNRAPPFGESIASAAFPWAQRAIIFLSDDQIRRRIERRAGNDSVTADRDPEDASKIISALKFQVARALIQAKPSLDIQELAQTWQIDVECITLLQIEGAIAASQDGDVDLARSLLSDALPNTNATEFHPSWAMAAARSALASDADELAVSYLERCPAVSIAEAERQHHSDRLVPAARNLFAVTVARSRLSLPLAQLEAPKNRLWRGIQHHLTVIGVAIGEIRSDRPRTGDSICKLVENSVRFLAVARRSEDEEVFSDYQISRAAEILLSAIFQLVRLGSETDQKSLLLVDQQIESHTAIFRWWHGFRRQFALKLFALDSDQAAAKARLHLGLSDLKSYNPQEEIEERAEYAAAFGEIGETETARNMIATLRRNSLGAYLPAKKDGQYELWTSVLSLANSTDPKGRLARSQLSLRLLDGLSSTEGDDSARRAGRQILFEASAIGPKFALNASCWAAETGIFSWDGIIDATLRGILFRTPKLASPVLTTWSHLCLPWYAEPHGSTTETGQFLKDLMKCASADAVNELEEAAVRYIEALAQPDMKAWLLRILEEGARKRNAGNRSSLAADRWRDTSTQDNAEDPEHRSYHNLASLAEVSGALDSELEYYAAKGEKEKQPNRRVTYGLRRAAVRVIENSDWAGVESFVNNCPDLASHFDVQLAASRVAIAANDVEAAKTILASFLVDDEGDWGWPGDRRRLASHEVRHLLGEADAFDKARRAFTEDMADARYGVASRLWRIEDIFPLLFVQVPWPAIWDSLSAHIEGTRDYKIGKEVAQVATADSEADLIAALYCWGLTLGLPILNVEASRGAIQLLNDSQEALFISIINRLLEMDGEAQMMALELLTKAVGQADLAKHFQNRLPELCCHADGGIVAAASFLAQRWETQVLLPEAQLSPIYTFELPDHSSDAGNPASDAHTRGLVVDDVFGWTDHWTDLVDDMARYSGLAATNIRWRVGQLIQSWGGVASFGHLGSKKLEGQLSRLSMGMAYRRPQSEMALRALRYVVEELRKAGRMRRKDWQILLHKLRVYPDQAILLPPIAKPPSVLLPTAPRMVWGKDHQVWVEDVGDDLYKMGDFGDGAILAYWHQKLVRETRVTAISERWTCVQQALAKENSVEYCLDRLPRVIRLGGPVPLYEDCGAPFVATFNPYSMQGDPKCLLIFCPLAATQLGWTKDNIDAHSYQSSDGVLMAQTIWWRDGLPQPLDGDERSAEGQFVFLTRDGLRVFEGAFGPIVLASSASRRIIAERHDGDCVERFASDLSPSTGSSVASSVE